MSEKLLIQCITTNMDLVSGVADIAIESIDEFENLLFVAATAEANGFKTALSMYWKMVVVGSAGGATVGVLAFLEQVITGSKDGHSGDVFIAIMGFGFTVYGVHLYYREHMYKEFTGSGFIHVPLFGIAGCVGVPALVKVFQAKSGDRKKAMRKGILIGALFYIFIGIIPVIVMESRKKSAALRTMKGLFEHCYPYDASKPCPDKLSGFVQKFDSFIPDFIQRMLDMKNNKQGMLAIMDKMLIMQNIDTFRSLAKTPLGRLFGAMARTSKGQSPMIHL